MTFGPLAGLSAVIGAAGLGYYLTITGRLTVDTGLGRSVRSLGPQRIQIAAPIDTVFDVIATPYLMRTPRAMAGKVRVIERAENMVLAEHYTPVHHGWLTTMTLETVTFSRPNLISFRLIRGPVPYVLEEFHLSSYNGATILEYSGNLEVDFWAAGRWWAGRVATTWEMTVHTSLSSIKSEAERRARARHL
jgi:hypothetical protein